VENIRFADAQSRTDVYRMWKTVFGDDDAYMELYFGSKYRDENTLVYFHDNVAMASLQMLPYKFTFHGVEIDIAYVMGVCTLPEFRGKGFQDALLKRMLQVLSERNIPLAILVPAEPWLLEFYRKYGFAQTFEPSDKSLPLLKELKSRLPNVEDAYKEFDAFFRSSDMTVQKSLDDFKVIMREAELFNFPDKKSLIGMARIINAEYLLSVFAKQYPEKTLTIQVEDNIIPQNNQTFRLASGKLSATICQPTLTTDINLLSRLLLGYKTSELEATLSDLFPEKYTQINFMLE